MTGSGRPPMAIGTKDLEEAGWVARDALRPMDQAEVAIRLKVLFEMYGPVEFDSETESKLFWSAWYRDLAEWPADLVAEACERWRRSPAKSRPKTSGHLSDLIKDELLRRRAFDRHVKAAKVRMKEHDQWLSEHVAPVGSEEHTRIKNGLRDLAKRLRMGEPIRPISAERAQQNFEELRKAARDER